MNGGIRPPAITSRKIVLDNGLSVIASRRGGLPIVAVNLWYHVGSKNEDRHQRGFAHLFEHLMFEGSQHYPGDFFKPLQRLGASLNGSTSTDRTNYFEDVPSAHVELALAMESDRMAHLLPALDAGKLRIQKDVVKNEYLQNYANRPYGLVWKVLAEALYPPAHPYSWLTIGAMEDVEAAGLDDVEAFFRRFYAPANASLAVVGDIDEDRAFALAERYFGAIAPGTPALPPWTPPVALEAEREITLVERVELDRYYEIWPTVALWTPDDPPLALLADVLARGKASRLYQALVVREGLAQDVSVFQSVRELAGTFGVVVTMRPGRDWEQARGIVRAAIREMAERGPTNEELARVQNGRLAGFIYALDNVGGFGGVADRLNAYNTYLGNPDLFDADLDRYERVTSDAIRDAARRHIDGRPSVRLTVLGRKPATTTAPLDRSIAPQPAAARPFLAPVPEVRRLACGAELWVIPNRDLPIVAGTVCLPGGASAHGPEVGGLASLTADMIDEGTTSRSSLQIALEAEALGSHLSSSCGWDGSYIGFQSLTPHLAATLDLAVDLLMAPAFPEPEWARIRAQSLAGLRAGRDSAEARGHRALLKGLYPEGHPYRVPTDGEEATVAGLGRDQLVDFHARFYRPQGAAWIVAGDVDPDELARLLDRKLAGWAGHAERREEPTARRSTGKRLVLLDRPGAAQAVVRVGHLGTHRLDPDYTPLAILNHILGGQFTSRLNSVLREHKGLTYGVRSQYDFRRSAGPFSVSTSVQSDRVAEAVEAIRGELVGLIEDRPPTLVELDDARRSLIEGQARHFETPSALVSRYGGLFLHGLPPDHHRSFVERLEAVTAESLAEVAHRHLHPGSLTAVVVADADSVLESLERLDWGPVERVRDLEPPRLAQGGSSPSSPTAG